MSDTWWLTDSTNTTTNGVDNVTGTANNDVIVGTVTLTNAGTPVLGGSLNVTDTINGGAGTDNLSITVTGGGTTNENASSLSLATVSNVEAVSIRNLAVGSTTAALNDVGVTFAATGMSTITNDRSLDFVAFTAVANNATVNIKGAASTTTAQGATNLTFASGATTATVNFVDGTGTSGANSSGNVTIGSTLTSLAIGSTGAANAAGTVTTSSANNTESVTINATTNLTLATLTGYSTTVTDAKLTITGAGTTTITGALDATLDTLTASANTGGISVTLGGTGTTVTGGSGNDTVNVGTQAITKNITGGDGTDTIIFTDATNYTTAASKISGFETLRALGAGASYDVSLLSGITAIQTESGGAITFTNVGATTPIRVNNNITTSLTVGLASTSGTSDTVSVTIDDIDSTAAAITVAAITAAGVENLNITTGDTLAAGTPHVVSALTGSTAVTTLKVAGTSDLTITDATVPTGALTIDATGFTKALTVGAAATAGISSGDTVKGGSGADNLFVNVAALSTTTSFAGGTGDDTLTVFGNGSTIVDGHFAAMTGVDNLVVTSATNTSITLAGFAQAAIATVDANSNGLLDITATALTTGSTIDASALTQRGINAIATVANANGGGAQAMTVTGGGVADQITVTLNDTADSNDDDHLTASITGGNGIDTISITRTAADANDVVTVVSTTTTTANADIVTGFTTNSATTVFDYNGTLQATPTTAANGTVVNTVLGTAARGLYVFETDIANSGANTQGSAFSAVLSSSASTLAANYATLEAQLVASSGALTGTLSNLDAAIGNGSAALIALDNGTGTVVLRVVNSTSTANTFTADELELVGVFTNTVMTATNFV
jgi:hypothetical protein